jgi:hypothetical protein
MIEREVGVMSDETIAALLIDFGERRERRPPPPPPPLPAARPPPPPPRHRPPATAMPTTPRMVPYAWSLI